MSFSSQRILNKIETVGNKLPHPTLLFIYLSVFVVILSWLLSLLGVQATHPGTQQTITIVNLASQSGLHQIISKAVTNFTHFAPIGTVLVAVLGIGIAEHSGLLKTLFSRLLSLTSTWCLSFVVVLLGILSSMAVDTGYVVLIPLAAILFKNAGLNPILGIAAAFAGVSGGFSANLIIGPLDAILAGISTEASKLVSEDYEVHAGGNYYFMLISTFLISIVGAWITETITKRRYANSESRAINDELQSDQKQLEDKGLRSVSIFSVIFLLIILASLIPEQGLLRDPETNSILHSPFISGIVVIISFYFAIAGLLFGRASGVFKNNSEVVTAMEKTMTTMASYIVLMFFAAQFVNYFAWSNLGSIIAISGAEMLGSLDIHPAILLVLFVFCAAFINLFIGSASAKWALIAPIFVPMLMLLNISPEATQIAYRIGDSATNIITPLMPYFGVVVAFVQKYDDKAGIGTITSMMLPYSIAFLLAWSVLLLAWVFFSLPLGIDAPGALLN